MSQPTKKNSKTTCFFLPRRMMGICSIPESWNLFVVVCLLLLFVASGDASSELVPFDGMRLKATSTSIFWLQERLQAPGFVDFGNMTFSVVPLDDGDSDQDSGGGRRIMKHIIEKGDYGDDRGTRRKTRKRDANKQQTIIYVPDEHQAVDQEQPQQQHRQQPQPQQVLEAVLVPILKHCGGTNRLWDTMKLPSTGAVVGPKKEQQACDWQKLGIGVTVKSSQSSTGTIHHFCCSRAALDKGICRANQLGRLILNRKVGKRNHRQVALPTTAAAGSFSWSDNNSSRTEDIRFATNQTGDYLWILANCWDDGSDVLVDGTLVWNSISVANGTATTGLGNLVNSFKGGPQSKKPKFPENGFLVFLVSGTFCTLYGLIGLCCCCTFCRARRQFTNSFDIAHLYLHSALYCVAFLHLGLSTADLYVWGTRSGNSDFQEWWVWDGPEQHDEILRHCALVFGALKAGMARWLVLVQILVVPMMSSADNENKQEAQRKTQLWVTLVAITYTIICIVWGIVEVMAKDNLQNMKMLMDGEEKRLLKITAVLSAIAFFLNGWAYLWALYRFVQRQCRSRHCQEPDYRDTSLPILVLVTMCGIFVIYAMGTSSNKMNALFVWDHGITPVVTEAIYFFVLVFFLPGPRREVRSVPPDDTCVTDNESNSHDDIAVHAIEETSAEVEMASLLA